MGLKEILKKVTSEEKNIAIERCKASKFMFIIIAFLFFINFYFVGANFYSEFLTDTLTNMYILLLLSMLFFAYFFIKKKLFGKVSKFFFIIIFIILFIIFLFFMLPVVFPNGLEGALDFIKLYY